MRTGGSAAAPSSAPLRSSNVSRQPLRCSCRETAEVAAMTQRMPFRRGPDGMLAARAAPKSAAKHHGLSRRAFVRSPASAARRSKRRSNSRRPPGGASTSPENAGMIVVSRLPGGGGGQPLIEVKGLHGVVTGTGADFFDGAPLTGVRGHHRRSINVAWRPAWGARNCGVLMHCGRPATDVVVSRRTSSTAWRHSNRRPRNPGQALASASPGPGGAGDTRAHRPRTLRPLTRGLRHEVVKPAVGHSRKAWLAAIQGCPVAVMYRAPVPCCGVLVASGRPYRPAASMRALVGVVPIHHRAIAVA